MIKKKVDSVSSQHINAEIDQNSMCLLVLTMILTTEKNVLLQFFVI